jgi:hypothetical protein
MTLLIASTTALAGLAAAGAVASVAGAAVAAGALVSAAVADTAPVAGAGPLVCAPLVAHGWAALLVPLVWHAAIDVRTTNISATRANTQNLR